MRNADLLAERIAGTRVAKKTNQIILVVCDKLFFYQKENGMWNRILETTCEYGKNGYSKGRREGDGTTPIGAFELLYAFGIGDNPGTELEYKKILETSYYSADTCKPDEYNRWIESEEAVKGEHLIDFSNEYHYAIVIGFNINPVVVGKGSSIFLHCKGEKGYTAGCIAIDKKIMLELLKQIKPGSYIIIEPDEENICNY